MREGWRRVACRRDAIGKRPPALVPSQPRGLFKSFSLGPAWKLWKVALSSVAWGKGASAWPSCPSDDHRRWLLCLVPTTLPSAGHSPTSGARNETFGGKNKTKMRKRHLMPRKRAASNLRQRHIRICSVPANVRASHLTYVLGLA
jgi:hypothetical protein